MITETSASSAGDRMYVT